MEENYNNFGSKMILVEYKKWNDVKVYFPEYNVTIEGVRHEHFKDGSLKCPLECRTFGIGYIGIGEYTPANSKEAYDAWVHMLERCYDPKYQKKYISYKGCRVFEKWHNFQNFAEWYYKNIYQVNDEKMCLDKDILYKGNKEYNENTCIFVPNAINVLFTKSNKARGEYPIGVSYRKDMDKYRAYYNKNKKKIHLGTFNTPEEAFQAYKRAKENHIKEMADYYKEYIPKEVYEAMYNYEVEITD